ncbi:HAMP domain-containing histidine kinase [Candidatus Parcubacteria bacterium]|nr:HAMP domain-containing histidine kinase [Candidatus Parcubacteria bacterium]
MAFFFKKIWQIIKIYPGILYSLLLILFLPLFFYFHTFYVTSQLQKNIDLVLQTKASFLAKVLSLFFEENFDNSAFLQEKILELKKEHPEVKKLRVLKPEGNDFKIIASQEEKEIGAILEKDIPATLAWSQNQPIVTLTGEGKERFWRVIFPVKNKEETLVGLISLALSLKETDELLIRSVTFSFLMVVVGIIIALFLVLQHTNLLGYVELAKKLQEVDRAKDEFIRMATHELQSPVVNANAYILEIKERLKEKLGEEEKKYFEVVEISIKNLLNLIQDILQVTRIEQGRLDFTPKEIDPEQEIEQILKEFYFKAQEKNLDLIFDPERKGITLKINPIRFREIITNLVSNAIKYTFKGYVKVQTKVDLAKKRYYIFIIDTGIGISAEAQKKMFQKFFREKKRETAEIPGTGLGLWISKEIAKRMGGDILLESIEGRGSKFIVYFPI